MALAAKLMPIGSNFKAESHQADSLQTQNLTFLYEQKQTTPHSCRKQFLNLEDFKAAFVRLTSAVLDITSERDAIEGDFKWESHQVE